MIRFFSCVPLVPKGAVKSSLWYHFYLEFLPQKKKNKKLKFKKLNDCFVY